MQLFLGVIGSVFLRSFISRQFVWSGNLQNSKWSLINWDTVCRPKKEGGLVLHSAILCSQALVAKLYWRWCSSQSQLWARILSHKYLPGIEPSDVSRFPLEERGSMVWNTLKIGAHLVKRSLFWICNKGTEALFWNDSWNGHPPFLSSHPHLQPLCDFFLSGGWNKVAHYKEAHNLGLAVGYKWKNSSNWQPGGSLGIGWSFLRSWLLGSAALCRNLMFWLGEVLLLASILFLQGTLRWLSNCLARWRSLGGRKLGITFLGLSITFSSRF